MLIEVNKSILDKKVYLVTLTKDGASVVPLEEFEKEFKEPLDELKSKLEQPLTQIATIVKEKPVEVVNGYKEQMQKFSRVAAFQNLKDDMNYKGIEITDEELDQIYKFVYAENETECPKAFIPYLEKYSLNEPKTAKQEEVENE